MRNLHLAGHEILISTARGAHWRTMTERQLSLWNVPYDGLLVGQKPWAHYYIDDKATNAEEFFSGRHDCS